jgi:transcriptional regulator PpsR
MATLGAGGTRVVFGRDLRPLSRLRQDIAEAQQAMEQEYARLRQAEGRYRLLFERLADPALILDGTSLRVMEANPAALRLFRHGRHRLPGGLVTEGFAPASREAVRAVLDGVRSGGRADEARALLADGRTEAVVSAAAFRHEGTVLLLLRVTPGAGAGATEALAPEQSRMLKLIDAVPDAFVVTDADGRVVTANAAFLGLAGARSEEEVRGQPLERWLGGQDTEAEVLLAHLRQHGAVRLYRCVLRGEGGPAAEVEVSAATVTRGGQPHFGFSIRDVGPQARLPEAGGARPTRPVEQVARLIGQVPLRDLVREATDAIERICVEAALQLAGDNRSAAAEMLGLSRQSLYQKMHRHGLGGMAEGREPRH